MCFLTIQTVFTTLLKYSCASLLGFYPQSSPKHQHHTRPEILRLKSACQGALPTLDFSASFLHCRIASYRDNTSNPMPPSCIRPRSASRSCITPVKALIRLVQSSRTTPTLPAQSQPLESSENRCRRFDCLNSLIAGPIHHYILRFSAHSTDEYV